MCQLYHETRNQGGVQLYELVTLAQLFATVQISLLVQDVITG